MIKMIKMTINKIKRIEKLLRRQDNNFSIARHKIINKLIDELGEEND